MPGTNPLPCSHSAMAYDISATKILLLDTSTGRGAANGPGTTGSFLNQSFTWSGDSSTGNWTLVSTNTTNSIDPTGPLPVRNQMGMGYDSGSTELVMFGGAGESETAGVLDDTWTFSAAGVWVKQAPGNVPFGRYRHQMADLHGIGVLMFGGSNVLNFLEETWLWTGGVGGNWNQLAPATVPPARVDFAMAGSDAATNVLMFGGKGINQCFEDTWMWVGTSTGNWVQQFPSNTPPAMSEMCMAYDHGTTSYVMFGGRTDDIFNGPQTWVWTGGNGGNWHLATPAVTPSVRVGAQMAYDGTHVIMFGGSSEYDVFGHTWMWTGGTNGNWIRL